jgi:hypothetical protein
LDHAPRPRWGYLTLATHNLGRIFRSENGPAANRIKSRGVSIESGACSIAVMVEPRSYKSV